MNKVCLISLIISLAFAFKNETWEEEIFDANFVPDKLDDLKKILGYLNSQLSSDGISDIKFTSSKYQNTTLTEYLTFTYLQNNTLMRGMVQAVYRTDGEIQIAFELQDQLSESELKDWSNYVIPSSLDFYDNPSSVLYQIMTELEKKLFFLNSLFFQYIDIQYNLMSGLSLFKVKFFALNQNNEIEISRCLASINNKQQIEVTDITIEFESYLKQLRSELSTHQISDIKITQVRKQRLSLGELVEFTYFHNGKFKIGEALASGVYDSKCSIFEIKLQSDDSEDDNDWMNYPIPIIRDLKDNMNSPLRKIEAELKKQQADLRVLFIQFVDVKTRLANENQYKIQFYALNYDGELEIGTCLAQVIPLEDFVEIIDLQLKVYQNAFILKNKNQIIRLDERSVQIPEKSYNGFKIIDFLSDPTFNSWETKSYEPPIEVDYYSKDQAYKYCIRTLEENKLENIYISKIQTKLLRGIFGEATKLHFILKDSNERDAQYGSCLFAYIDSNAWGDPNMLVKLVELNTIS